MARERLHGFTGGDQVRFLTADLATLAHVRASVQGFENRFERLDVLINNAGVDVGKRVTTPDGPELTFAVNYVAPF